MRKNPHQNGKERLTHNLAIKPTPSTAGRKLSQELDLNSTSALPDLRTASERGPFKTSSFENQRGSSPEDTKCYHELRIGF